MCELPLSDRKLPAVFKQLKLQLVRTRVLPHPIRLLAMPDSQLHHLQQLLDLHPLLVKILPRPLFLLHQLQHPHELRPLFEHLHLHKLHHSVLCLLWAVFGMFRHYGQLHHL